MEEVNGRCLSLKRAPATWGTGAQQDGKKDEVLERRCRRYVSEVTDRYRPRKLKES